MSNNLYTIAKNRKYLTQAACNQAMQALVTSHLDYANSLLVNLPQSTIQPLQLIQNMAAKITLGMRKYDSSAEALKTLHWLPIEQRAKFKTCVMVYKCIHKEAPEYLQELIKSNREVKDRNLRNIDNLAIPKTNGTKFADRAFMVAGPKLYNSLPKTVKEAENVNIFKSRLKTHLCRQVFD